MNRKYPAPPIKSLTVDLPEDHDTLTISASWALVALSWSARLLRAFWWVWAAAAGVAIASVVFDASTGFGFARGLTLLSWFLLIASGLLAVTYSTPKRLRPGTERRMNELSEDIYWHRRFSER